MEAWQSFAILLHKVKKQKGNGSIMKLVTTKLLKQNRWESCVLGLIHLIQKCLS